MASRGFWDRFLDMLFGESAHPEVERPVLGAPMLSNWLPYRSYDKKSRMFVNTESLGFILELAPKMGADERSGEILTQFLSDAVPSGCEIQLIHWQSPSVGERIADNVTGAGLAARWDRGAVGYLGHSVGGAASARTCLVDASAAACATRPTT